MSSSIVSGVKYCICKSTIGVIYPLAYISIYPMPGNSRPNASLPSSKYFTYEPCQTIFIESTSLNRTLAFVMPTKDGIESYFFFMNSRKFSFDNLPLNDHQ